MHQQQASQRAARDNSNLAPELRRALRLLFLFGFDRQLLFCDFTSCLLASDLFVLFCELRIFQLNILFQRRDDLVLQ